MMGISICQFAVPTHLPFSLFSCGRSHILVVYLHLHACVAKLPTFDVDVCLQCLHPSSE